MQVRIGKKTYTILFPDLLRPLTDPERSALKASIRKHGVHVPVLCDEDDGIIDGGHRALIACELKLPVIPTTLCRRGMSLEEKAALGETVNASRRHLKPAEIKEMEANRKERIASVVAARKEGASLRAIAAAEGVSLGQVQRDLADSGVSPDTPETITGLDGKSYSPTKSLDDVDWDDAPTPTPADEWGDDPAETHSREPGDDTDTIAEQRREERAKPKVGSEVFRWREFDAALGVVVRGVDALPKAYPHARGMTEHCHAQRLLTEFVAEITAWRKRIASDA